VLRIRGGVAQRLGDGLVLHGVPKELGRISREEIEGAEITVLQTKRTRLGMSVMGQAFFSRELMKKLFLPAVVHTVVICDQGDAVLEDLCRAHNIVVETYAESHRARYKHLL